VASYRAGLRVPAKAFRHRQVSPSPSARWRTAQQARPPAEDVSPIDRDHRRGRRRCRSVPRHRPPVAFADHVLINGESGTARNGGARAASPQPRATAVHRAEHGRDPEGLMESELFGQRRAPSRRAGAAARASSRPTAHAVLDEMGHAAETADRLLRVLATASSTASAATCRCRERAHHRRHTRTSSTWCARGFRETSTIAERDPHPPARGCVTGARTSRAWRGIFLKARRRARREAKVLLPETETTWPGCRGPATCASWRMPAAGSRDGFGARGAHRDCAELLAAEQGESSRGTGWRCFAPGPTAKCAAATADCSTPRCPRFEPR